MGWSYIVRVGIVVTGLCWVTGCVIPPRLELQVVDSRYQAFCECLTCFDVDPETGECLDNFTQQRKMWECAKRSDEISAEQLDDLEDEFRFRCRQNDNEDRRTFCRLIRIDEAVALGALDPGAVSPTGNDFVNLHEEEACPELTFEGAIPGRLMDLTILELEPSSRMTIIAPEGEGTTNLRGRFYIDGLDCDASECPIRLAGMDVRGDDFEFVGEEIRDPYVFNPDVGKGSYFPDDGILLIEAGTLNLVASGRVGSSRRGLQTENGDVGMGVVDPDERTMTLRQIFVEDDVTFVLDLDARIDNIQPILSIEVEEQVECGGEGTGTVIARAVTSDPDSNEAPAIDWFVDGAFVPVFSDRLEIPLPLGVHEITVRAIDEDMGVATESVSIEVVDTRPPELSVAELCIWPPNHELRFLGDALVENLSRDACGGDVEARVVSASSNELGDHLGDGTTAPDVLLGDEGVCLRAERSGLGGGRLYEATFQIRDESGNSTIETVRVRVPHDRGVGAECRGSDGRLLPSVEDSDARCERTLPPLELAGDSRESANVSPSAGCSAAGRSAAGSMVALLLALWMVGRCRYPRSDLRH